MLRKLVFCDDEPSVHCQLMGYLEQLAQECGDEFETVHFSSGEDMVAHFPSNAQLLLLDIQMAGISGIEAAHKLRETHRDLIIILVTNLIDRAIQGYEVHAFSFLCKPVMYGDFRRNLLDAFALYDKARPVKLALNTDGGTELIPLDKLLYVEVFHHTTSLVFFDRRQDVRVPLFDLEGKTRGRGFFRCHKSYLVNFLHIQRIDPGSIIMANGDEILLSKHRRKEFLSEYSFFAGERL